MLAAKLLDATRPQFHRMERYAWVTNGACTPQDICRMERRAEGARLRPCRTRRPPLCEPHAQTALAAIRPGRQILFFSRRSLTLPTSSPRCRSMVLNTLGFRLRLPTLADFLPAFVDAYDAQFGTDAEGRCDVRHRDFAVGCAPSERGWAPEPQWNRVATRFGAAAQ